jgi:hypothetical protein
MEMENRNIKQDIKSVKVCSIVMLEQMTTGFEDTNQIPMLPFTQEKEFL